MHIVPSTAKISVKNSKAKRPAMSALATKHISNDTNATHKYNATKETISE
jgi:hypothetical protein